jgi:2-polyprenyl-3-methyl-5-hydroxy-6-metoxy-1,4-benzoquinol methylase
MPKLPVGHYSSRAERAQFIAMNFAPYLSGRVLDVGCGDAFLEEYVARYVGVDIAGKSDVFVDLERGGLPFRDKSFDAVMCIDVLEHLDPLAEVLAELFRVANRYVVISLPNMYALGYRLKFLRGQVISKEYSLVPRNRHKWLPSFSEVRSFVQARLPQDWHIKWEFGYYPRAWWRVGPVYKLLARSYPNLLATVYWGLFERRLP